MKRVGTILPMLFCAAFGALALPADLTYVEGEATFKPSIGHEREASIGDRLDTGDTLRTGADGSVEMDQGGAVIALSPGTVFTLMERSDQSGTLPVLSLALGSMKLRVAKITGREPALRSHSCAAGIRGTEITLFAGADGSSLIVVDSGAAVVEAAGQTVELAAAEAVEIPLDGPPGEKIAIRRDQVDYRNWNEGKLAALLADPVVAMAGLRARLAGYVAAITEEEAAYRAAKASLDEERQKRSAVAKEKGTEAGQKYEAEVVQPIIERSRAHFLNVRYHALAALSLRRFVAGRLYVMLKPRELVSPGDPVLAAFRAEMQAMLRDFEESVVPHLVGADI